MLNTGSSKIIRQDKRISLSVVIYYILSATNSTIKTVLPISDSLWKPISILFGLIIISFICYNFKIVYKRASKLFIVSVFLFIIIYLVSILKSTIGGFPIDLIIKGSAFNTFIWWIPIGLFAYSVHDKRILYNTFLKGSFFITIILTFSLLGHKTVSGNEYNMFFSYSLVLPLLFHLNEFFKTKSKGFFILFIYELLAILIYGARGPILCILFFVLSKKLFDVKSISKKVGFTFALLIISTFFIIFFDHVLGLLESFMSNYNINSRTLSMFIGGVINDDVGRKEIWRYSFKMIEEKPLTGWGLGGEFYPLAQMMGQNSNVSTAFTPHNGILQLWINFGLIIGTIIGFYIIQSVFRVRKIINSNLREILYIFFSASLVPAFTIGSGIFTEPSIAIYLFLFIWSRRHY